VKDPAVRLTIVTSFPTWAVWTLAFGSPVLTAGTAFLGQYVGHRAARDQEIRSRREEVMRNLRWCSELAVSDDAARARLGVEELEALGGSKMLTVSDRDFVYAALRAVIKVPHQIIQTGREVDVIVRTGSDGTRETPVSSEEGEEGEEADI
jgi:hypothetical protein